VSTNGLNWAVTSGGTTRRLQGITYGAGLYLATGQAGTRAVSTDSTNWTANAVATFGYAEAVMYTNGVFVAVGSSGIYTSSDANNWVVRAYTPELESVIHFEGMFIAGGDHGAIYTSTNLVDWVRRKAPPTRSLRQLIYARGSVWAVGNNEAILQSGQFRPYLDIGTGGPSAPLIVRAEPGQTITLQRSSDLGEWSGVGTQQVGPGDTVTFIDTLPAGPRRFYRAFQP
jgi:hypothetical protein